MYKKTFFTVCVVILLVGLFFIIRNKEQSRKSLSSRSNKLQVTTSFYPLWYFASQIGKEKAEIYNIIPAGAEPHDYELSVQDVVRIEKSNILILNGGIEPWEDKITSSLNKDVLAVIASHNLLNQEKDTLDPHIWLDPQLAKEESNIIAKAFITADSTNRAYYESNEKSLQSEFDRLDMSYRDGLKTCKQKDIITSHAAFGYLAKRYGLNQVSIAGLSPDEEPSSQQLAQIAAFAKKHNVKYIFFESLVSPKLSQIIANEIGAKTLVLDPIEGIDDNDIKAGENYFTIMKKNLKNLQIALQCN